MDKRPQMIELQRALQKACDVVTSMLEETEPSIQPKQDSVIKCFDDCGGDFIIRNGKHGKFYGCTRFPDCKCTAYICPECGFPMMSYHKCSECNFTRERRQSCRNSNVVVAPAAAFNKVMGAHFAQHLNEKYGEPGYTFDGEEEEEGIGLPLLKEIEEVF